MTTLRVHGKPGSPVGMAMIEGQSYACALGRSGVIPAEKKREGDGATPLGTYRLLYGFYRPDRVAPPKSSPLLWLPLTPELGWCDAPTDPAYNSLVPKGYTASHEALWREDTAYDRVIVLSHNLPATPGLGSAVFLHQLHPGKEHTAGCVAFSATDFEGVLAAKPIFVTIQTDAISK